MKLSQREFDAMNNPIRRWLQRMIEYPNFKRMGLQTTDLDVLEIGCGKQDAKFDRLWDSVLVEFLLVNDRQQDV